MRPNRRIYLRLFLPFAVALLLATGLAWWAALSLMNAALERRLEAQLAHAVGVLAEGSFPLTPELIGRLGTLLRAEIVLIGADGQPYAEGGTLASDPPALQRIAQTEGLQRLRSAAGRYAAAVKPLPANRDARFSAIVALASLEDIHAAGRQVGVLLAALAGVGILVLAFAGHRIARGITLPIQELAGMAGRIADGDRSVRARMDRRDEIGELTAALNVMADRLEAYEQDIAEHSRLAAIGQTAARVAHEVRNPLTAMKMQVELMSESAAPEQRERLAMVLDEIRRLELIVSGTLQLGRPAALARRPTDVNALVGDIAALLGAQFKHRGIALQVRLQEDLPTVSVDRDRIKQVLLNLLMNAGDELQDGGTVRLSTGRSESGALEVRVEDSGAGVPADRRPAIFGGRSDKPGGLGLGLRICRELVEMHGGDLSVDDSDLGGAAFCMRLPVET